MAGGSNWAKLKSKIAPTTSSKKKAATQKAEPTFDANLPLPRGKAAHVPGGGGEVSFASIRHNDKTLEMKMRKLAVAVDCEMVGIGPNGRQSALARCSVVDFDGNVLFDKFVQPKGFVTDFRTKYSGIRKADLTKTKAIPLEVCQSEVVRLLKGKILVGHALKNDLTALLLSHPRMMIRDTSHYKPYMRHNPHTKKYKPRALRELVKEHLHKTIQTGEHDSVEDARCTMMVYRLAMEEWEKTLRDMKNDAREKAIANSKKNKKDVAASVNTATTTQDSDEEVDGESDFEQEEDDIEHSEEEEEVEEDAPRKKARC